MKTLKENFLNWKNNKKKQGLRPNLFELCSQCHNPFEKDQEVAGYNAELHGQPIIIYDHRTCAENNLGYTCKGCNILIPYKEVKQSMVVIINGKKGIVYGHDECLHKIKEIFKDDKEIK